jgi:hypothetical protein
MSARPGRAVGLALALGALGLAGCGGSHATTVTVTTGSVAAAAASGAGGDAGAAQFVAQATRICEGVRTQQAPLKGREEALKGQLGRSAASADLAFSSLASQAAAIAQAALGRLAALPRPPAEAQAIEQVLQAYSEQVGDARTIAAASASRQNSRGEAAAGALGRSVLTHSAAARKLGMGECFGLE